jgi:hypothetical protein
LRHRVKSHLKNNYIIRKREIESSGEKGVFFDVQP